MTRSINIFFSMLFLAYLCVAAAMYPKIGLAQVEPNSAYFNVLQVDRGELPSVELTLAGGEIASDEMASNEMSGGFIQSAEVEIIEDGIMQTILQDRVEESALQLAVLVDPRTLEIQGASGQPRYLEMVGLVLKLIAGRSDDVTLANEQFAALVAGQGGLQTIQDWTEDPDQLFNSIMKRRSEMIIDDGSLIHDSILAALDTFRAVDASTRSTKALLLFSAGLDGDNLSEAVLDELVMQLRAAQIQLYVAQFASSGQPVVADESLLRLARATNGYSMVLGEEADLNGLFQQIEATRHQRIVTYNSEQLTPNEINIQLALADGSSLTKQVSSSGEMLGSNPLPTLLPTAEPSEGSMEVDVAEGLAESGSTDAILIPGTEISISRNVILAALAVLLALLAYFLFTDTRAQRAEKKRQAELESMYEDGGQELYPEHHNYLRSQRGADVMRKASAEANDVGNRQSILAEESYLEEPWPQDAAASRPIQYDLVEEDTVVKIFNIHESGVPEVVKPESTAQEPVVPEVVVTEPAAREASVQEPVIHEVDEPESLVQEPVIQEVDEREAVEPESLVQAPAIQEPVAQEVDEHEAVEPESLAQAPVIQEIIENGPTIAQSQQQRNLIDSEQPTFDTMVSQTHSPHRVAPPTEVPGKDGRRSEIPADDQLDDILRLQPSLETMQIMGYFIRVTDDPNLPLRLPLYKLESTNDEARQLCIGRNGQVNSIVINAKRISREHAIVIQKKGRLYLRDNNSTSGTFLNWQRLNEGEELLIRDNDLIGFGDISYEFRLQGEQKGTGLIL